MGSELARLLRSARDAAGLSQLELALRLEVSQRHLSFVELGRARPSRELLMSWLHEVASSSSLCNAALLQAGYAPMPARLDPPGEASRSAAVIFRTINLHQPNPGLVFDADWRIVRMNAAGRRLCQIVMPELWSGDDCLDMLATLAHPCGWLACAREPKVVAAALLYQLRAEQWLRPALGCRIDALEHTWRLRYGPLKGPNSREPATTSYSVVFDTRVGPLSFTAVQILVGLPHDAAGGVLRAELWFPTDPATSQVLRRLDVDAGELAVV